MRKTAVPTTAATTAVPPGVQECVTDWGSRGKSLAGSSHPQLTGIRAGRHECFDRLVFDLRDTGGGLDAGCRARYVETLHQLGSGGPVPVGGGAVLEVVVGAPSYDVRTGEPTYDAEFGAPLPGIALGGHRAFRDARFAGGFEGETQIGLGVRARLPFRVFRTADHLVVDVAHTW
ncbi:hypothetical protein ACFV1B_19610 [Streptomyces sp. NPDC059637]|uniref:AMIN-like domain-containing (lipo)protein n=1 Tax=Streptomyces sp. NPDC059637 TaxID=3347752 RepID=UPI00369DDF68